MHIGIPYESGFRKLLSFLDRLEEARVWYRLDRIRDSILVLVATPGHRWEVEFFEDGHVEVERFISPGVFDTGNLLEKLLEEISAG